MMRENLFVVADESMKFANLFQLKHQIAHLQICYGEIEL